MGCGGSKAAPPGAQSPLAVELIEEEHEGPDIRPDAEYIWFWQEDSEKVSQHHTWRKMGNFIAYPPKVSAHIEAQWIDTMIEGGAQFGKSAPLEITYKVSNTHTGFNYSVDFTMMKQINSGSGYQRTIKREPNPDYRPPAPAYYAESTPSVPGLPVEENSEAPVVVGAVVVTPAAMEAE